MQVVYILTLGVVEAARRQGVAAQLLRLVLAAAEARGCRACFLHVISYNHAAIAFYLAQDFDHAAELRNFYLLSYGSYMPWMCCWSCAESLGALCACL